MNWLAVIAALGTSAVRQRVERAKQQAAWGVLAGLCGLGALVAFLCALQVWLAAQFGPFYADLIIGVGLFLLALCCLLGMRLSGAVGRANQINLPEIGSAARSSMPQLLKRPASRWPLLIGGAAVAGLLFGRFTSRD